MLNCLSTLYYIGVYGAKDLAMHMCALRYDSIGPQRIVCDVIRSNDVQPAQARQRSSDFILPHSY